MVSVRTFGYRVGPNAEAVPLTKQDGELWDLGRKFIRCRYCKERHPVYYSSWNWADEFDFYITCPKAGRVRITATYGEAPQAVIRFKKAEKGGWWPIKTEKTSVGVTG